MKLIGISGKKQSGKSSVAEIISMYRPNVVVYNFATELKSQLARMLGVTPDYIDRHKDNFRLILQGYGTDYKRKLHGEDYWVKLWKEAVERIIEQSPSSLIVTADVRFMNEVECIKKMGGEVWRIERLVTIGVPNSDTHESETKLDSFNYQQFDCVIFNDGTYEQLAEKVKQQLNK